MKKSVYIIINMILLIFACALFSACGNEESYDLPEGRDEDGTLQIFAGEELLGTVTMSEIQGLTAREKSVAYQSTSEGAVKGEFTGALLADIIALVDKNILTNYDKVTAYGSDGYYSVIAMDDVRQINNVYIMYLNNKEPLPIYKGKAEGSMRLIVTNDEFGMRFTNFLVDLVFEKEEKI